jgi:hypothetical protein
MNYVRSKYCHGTKIRNENTTRLQDNYLPLRQQEVKSKMSNHSVRSWIREYQIHHVINPVITKISLRFSYNRLGNPDLFIVLP